MKNKRFLIFICCLIVMFSFSLLLTGCQDDEIQLNAPCFLEYQVDPDLNLKLIITDRNTKASKYVFYISDGDIDADLSDYIEYVTDKPYLNVSELFVEARDYHFYCRYLGSGKYADSEISEVKHIQNKYSLEIPHLYMNGTNLSWTFINNAVSYSVYANGRLIEFEEDAGYTTLSTQYNFEDDLQSFTQYEFYVKANGTGNYVTSGSSNRVVYSDHLILRTPSSLTFSEGVLHWNNVANASSYEILVDNLNLCTSNTNSYDFSSILTEAKQYTFKVKAIGSGNFTSGEYSAVFTYDNYIQLESPSGMTYFRNGEYLEISWNAVVNASSYSVFINGELFSSFVDTNGIAVRVLESYGNVVTVSVIANGAGYHTSSLPSDDFNIYLIDF